MPEALTESFCERCGTRYEFSAPTQLNTIRKTRGLISGLKNYIMSQDALSDAMGDAMRSEEAELAGQQLQAFHDSFNFCIDCRQYTCVNCWNESAGRCRSCVPIPGTDDLLERFETAFHAQHPELSHAAAAEMAEAELQRLGVEAWPTTDLAAAIQNEAAPEWPAEEIAPPEPAVTAEVEVEPVAEPVVAVEPEPEPAVTAEVEVEPVAAVEPEREPEPLVVAEVEPEIPEPAPIEQPEPVMAEEEGALVSSTAEPDRPQLTLLTWEPDGDWELTPEPIVAEVEEAAATVAEEPPVEPVAAEAEEPAPAIEEPPPAEEPPAEELPARAAPRPVTHIRPISETILRMPERPAAPPAPTPAPAPRPTPVRQPMPVEPEREKVAAAADDAALAARRAQLDLLGLDDTGEGPVAAGGQNVLPYRSRGASVHPAEVAMHAGAGAAGGARSFWEASAMEVAGAMSQIGVQSCGDCGLSLSATARFCRRCGTRQARSA